MKIVYEIERLSTNGGIEHILTDRVNYMAERWGWNITILVILKEDKEPYWFIIKENGAYDDLTKEQFDECVAYLKR